MATSKDQIIQDYYQNYFDLLCNSGAQGLASKQFHLNIEKYWEKPLNHLDVLEVGAGVGEHLTFAKFMNAESVIYNCLDIRKEPDNFKKLVHPLGSKVKTTWKRASVEKIPFENESFDRVISTCLFHHIENPLAGLEELRRVTRHEAEIAIGLPTDPGFLNSAIKKIITYPKARRLGISDPEFIYALEHPNKIKAIISLAKHVFKEDELYIHYWPLRLASLNLNLQVILKVIRNKK